MNWNRGIRLNEEKWSLEKTSVRKRKEKGERTKRGREKEKKGRKFRSENAFLHWRYFIFLKPPLGDLFVSRASSHVILSVIRRSKERRNDFEGKGKEGGKYGKIYFRKFSDRGNVCKRAEYPMLITSFRYRKCSTVRRANTIFN